MVAVSGDDALGAWACQGYCIAFVGWALPCDGGDADGLAVSGDLVGQVGDVVESLAVEVGCDAIAVRDGFYAQSIRAKGGQLDGHRLGQRPRLGFGFIVVTHDHLLH